VEEFILLFTSRRKTILLTLAGVTAVAAIACGSDDPPARIATQTPFATSAAQPTATQAPAATATQGAGAPTAEATTAPASSASPGGEADRVDLTSDNFDWLVDDVGKGTKPAIAIAPDGTPNIAFMFEAISGGFVKAGTRVGGAWDISTVAEGYYYGPLDIDVGPDGTAQVAWHDHQSGSFNPSLGDIELAVKTASGWSFKTLAHRGHDGWDTRLIIDDKGVVHAAGIDPQEFGGGGVEYYRLDTNGDLTVEGVGSGPLTYKFAVSVDVDSAGTPYVTYYNQDSNDLILASKSGGDWTLETVDADGDAGQFAELVIDDSDRLHISYATQTGSGEAVVKYATRGSGESDWTITEVDTLSNIVYGQEGARELTSIKIDSTGNPWIAYTDEVNLKLAVWDGGAFRTETISTSDDRGTDFGQLVSLGLDADDVAHIVIFEVTGNRPLSGNILYFKGTAR
jgi:hypothetical protein